MKSESIFANFPALATDNLVLRELRPADAPRVLELFSDPEVTRYYDLDLFSTIEEACQLVDRFIQRFAKQIGIRWAIAESNNPDDLVGTCGYNIWIQASKRAVLGFDLARTHWNRGIMTEALTAVLQFGFEKMALNRVEALVITGNEASCRLLGKLGFQKEGTLRQYELVKGRYVDMEMFSILGEDLRGARRARSDSD
jgi:ribosomal-protein-alanine N-acetyltransferase